MSSNKKPRRKLNITPDTSLFEKIGLGNFKVSEAISELVANCFDARVWVPGVDGNETALPLSIEITVDSSSVVIVDDGIGMDESVLESALTLARDMDIVTGSTRSRMGMFGLGMKSASASLGRNLEVITKQAGQDAALSATLNSEVLRANREWEAELYDVNPLETVLGERSHGTALVITDLYETSPNMGPIFALLARAYKPLLAEKNSIKVNGEYVIVEPYDLVPDSRVEIDLVIDEDKNWRVTGWAGLDYKTHNDGLYGFQLYRMDQLIDQWNKDFFRAHLMSSRIVGELNLDFVPTNYTKKGFRTESREWRSAAVALKEELRPLVVASGNMSKGKNDPQRVAKAIQGLQAAMGISDDFSSYSVGFSESQAQSEVSDGKSLDRKPDEIVISQDSITIGGVRTSLSFILEDFGDETVLWDFIYDDETAEIQTVLNTGSTLYGKSRDTGQLGILAMADCVARCLVKDFGLGIERAMQIRDTWALKASER